MEGGGRPAGAGESDRNPSWEKLQERVVTAWQVRGAVVGLLAGGAGGALVTWLLGRVLPAMFGGGAELEELLAPLHGAIVVGLGGLLMEGLLLPVKRYRRFGFHVGEMGIRLKGGVLVHWDTWIPYTRLQYVELRRGPLERAFRLSSLRLYTAGSESGDVPLPGLDPARAEEVRERLLELIGHETV